MADGTVFVSILHWFSRGRTSTCIESVQNSQYDDVEVVISNNGPESEQEYFRKEFPEATVLQNKGNVGFAAGHNRVLEYADDPDGYVFFLNNDAVVEPDTLSSLVATAQDVDGRALFAPRVYQRDTDGTEQLEFTAGYFDWLRGEPHSYASEIDNQSEPLPEELTQDDIEYLHGAALFGSVKTLSELGAFDESFFIYYEDADISQRAKDRSMQLEPVDDVTVYHLEYDEADLPILEDFRAYLILRNKFWFMYRHAPRPTFYLFIGWYLMYRYPRHLWYAATERQDLKHALFATYGVIAALTFSSFRQETVVNETNETVLNEVD